MFVRHSTWISPLFLAFVKSEKHNLCKRPSNTNQQVASRKAVWYILPPKHTHTHTNLSPFSFSTIKKLLKLSHLCRSSLLSLEKSQAVMTPTALVAKHILWNCLEHYSSCQLTITTSQHQSWFNVGVWTCNNLTYKHSTLMWRPTSLLFLDWFDRHGLPAGCLVNSHFFKLSATQIGQYCPDVLIYLQAFQQSCFAVQEIGRDCWVNIACIQAVICTQNCSETKIILHCAHHTEQQRLHTSHKPSNTYRSQNNTKCRWMCTTMHNIVK